MDEDLKESTNAMGLCVETIGKALKNTVSVEQLSINVNDLKRQLARLEDVMYLQEQRYIDILRQEP